MSVSEKTDNNKHVNIFHVSDLICSTSYRILMFLIAIKNMEDTFLNLCSDTEKIYYEGGSVATWMASHMKLDVGLVQHCEIMNTFAIQFQDYWKYLSCQVDFAVH